jgi:hypothetical protein
MDTPKEVKELNVPTRSHLLCEKVYIPLKL